ncbi:hypothetical protein BDV18DRAFT_97266 [Aspergillus unguis]
MSEQQIAQSIDMEAQTTQNQNSGWSEEDMKREPFRYVGYRGYSKFKASAANFAHFRRFDHLNMHVILRIQDRIVQVEEEIENVEFRARQPEAINKNNGTFRDRASRTREELPVDVGKDTGAAREDLLDKAEGLLEKYNGYLRRHAHVQGLPTSTERERQSLHYWHGYHRRKAIAEKERKYIEKKDLCRIMPLDANPLRDLLVKLKVFRWLPFWRPASEGDILPYYVGELDVELADNVPLEGSARILNIGAGVALLVAPIWILANVESVVHRLAVSTIFIVIFPAVLASTTPAKPLQVLGLTAAYCTILMVFYQATKP